MDKALLTHLIASTFGGILTREQVEWIAENYNTPMEEFEKDPHLKKMNEEINKALTGPSGIALIQRTIDLMDQVLQSRMRGLDETKEKVLSDSINTINSMNVPIEQAVIRKRTEFAELLKRVQDTMHKRRCELIQLFEDDRKNMEEAHKNAQERLGRFFSRTAKGAHNLN